MAGHLKQWMQDATNNILTEHAAGCYADMELSESALSDLQAARELEELTRAAWNALQLIYNYSNGQPITEEVSKRVTLALRNALLAMED